MKIIGLTGGSGSGKTTALRVLRDMGALVLDCDAIYHHLLETDQNLIRAIDQRFSGVVELGQVDRKKLGQLVFHDSEALQALNQITHTAVIGEVRQRLAGWHGDYAAIDAIGLFESGLSDLCDVTVAVVAPREERIGRLMQRDHISYEYALARIEAQPEDAVFEQHCDYVLHNQHKTREHFAESCKSTFRAMLQLNRKKDV